MKPVCRKCKTVLTLQRSMDIKTCRACAVYCPKCHREQPRLVPVYGVCDECLVAELRQLIADERASIRERREQFEERGAFERSETAKSVKLISTWHKRLNQARREYRKLVTRKKHAARNLPDVGGRDAPEPQIEEG